LSIKCTNLKTSHYLLTVLHSLNLFQLTLIFLANDFFFNPLTSALPVFIFKKRMGSLSGVTVGVLAPALHQGGGDQRWLTLLFDERTRFHA
jgi:hypothetical protein